MHTRITPALFGIVITLGLAACTQPGQEPEPTSESWSAEQEAEAVRAATQAVRDYYHVTAQCLSDPPNTDPSCLERVSMDAQLENDKIALEYFREHGIHMIGEVEVVGDLEIVEVRLFRGVGEVDEITFSICSDATRYDWIGPDGTSVTPSHGPQRGRSTHIVRKWTDTWKVSETLDPEGAAEC